MIILFPQKWVLLHCFFHTSFFLLWVVVGQKSYHTPGVSGGRRNYQEQILINIWLGKELPLFLVAWVFIRSIIPGKLKGFPWNCGRAQICFCSCKMLLYISLTLPDAHFDLRGIESFDVGPQVAVEDVHQNRLEHHLCYQFPLYSVSTVCNVPESERQRRPQARRNRETALGSASSYATPTSRARARACL